MAQFCYLRPFLGTETVSCYGKDGEVEKFALFFFSRFDATLVKITKSEISSFKSSAQLSESSGQFKAPLTVLFTSV